MRILLFLLSLCAGQLWAQQNGVYDVITTYAGGGQDVFTDEGGQAVDAQLVYPRSVARDLEGNLFIADSGANRVRKVDTNGLISTVAGTGQAGYSGDTGPAALAGVPGPFGVATDGDGNLYIIDAAGRIRQVTADGTIRRIASVNPVGAGNYFVPNGGQIGMVADSNGNLYVSDPGGSRVVRVAAGGGMTTVAGNGQQGYGGDDGPATAAMLNYPSGLALDSKGNLYIADSENNRLRVVAPDGTIRTFAGNGQRGFATDNSIALNAPLQQVSAVGVDRSDTVYFADALRVYKLTSDGHLHIIAGNGNGGDGQAATASLGDIGSLAVSAAGDVFALEAANHRLRHITPDNLIETVAGTDKALGDGGPAISAALNLPEGIAADRVGNLYIAEATDARVRKVAPDGTITTFAGTGLPHYSGDNGPAALAGLSAPTAVATDSAGNVYIADSNNQRIRKVTTNGIITTIAGGGSIPAADGVRAVEASFTGAIAGAIGIVADDNGNVYFAEADPAYVWKITPDGILQIVAGTGQNGFGPDSGDALSIPFFFRGRTLVGMVLDAQGNLFFSETYNYRVRKLAPNGLLTTVAGTGQSGNQGDRGSATQAGLGLPTGLALDAAGNLYVADTGNFWVRKISPDGVITRYAGTYFGFRGDGMPAEVASLSSPFGLAVGSDGAIYVADSGNNRIRKIASAKIQM